MIGRHRLLDHFAVLAVALGEFAFEIGNDAIGQFAGALIFAAPLRLGKFVASVVELLLHFLRLTELVLLGPPALGQYGGLLLQPRQFPFEPRKPVLGGRVGFFPQRLLFDAQLDDAPVEFVKLLGLGVDLHAQARTRLVHQVDGLVRQEAVGDVAVGEHRRRHQRAVADPHAVMQLVFLLQAAQDRDRILDRRLADEHRLEPPRQRRVLLDIFAVFVERGRADAMQFTAREGWLQQIGGVHRAVGLARADQRVHLVDKQDHPACRRRDLVQHRLDPFLELAAIFRAGDQRAHVERQ